MSHRLARQAARGQLGMTAAELLAASAVIGVGLLALAAVLPVTSHALQEGTQLSTAVFLANQRLEQVRSARWEAGATPVDEVGLSTPAHVAPRAAGATTFPDETPVVAPFGDYTRRVRILDCAAGCGDLASPDLRQVIVEVTYRPLAATGVAAPAHRNGAVLSLYVSRR
jgi:hypothetical protein